MLFRHLSCEIDNCKWRFCSVLLLFFVFPHSFQQLSQFFQIFSFFFVFFIKIENDKIFDKNGFWFFLFLPFSSPLFQKTTTFLLGTFSRNITYFHRNILTFLQKGIFNSKRIFRNTKKMENVFLSFVRFVNLINSVTLFSLFLSKFVKKSKPYLQK